MSNEAIEVVEQEPSAFDAANSSMVLVDGWKASNLITELREQETSTKPTSITADSPAVTPTVEDAEVSALISTLGGVQGLQQLVAISAHENPAQLMNALLSPSQRNELIYSIVEDANVQHTLLNDPEVKQAISNYYFGGNNLDDIADAVAESYQPTPEFEARQAEQNKAQYEAARSVQLDVFHDSALEVASRYGVDLNDARNSVAIDAWSREVAAFAWQHRSEIDNAVRWKAKGGPNGLLGNAATAKLTNQFKAHCVRLMTQLKGEAKTATKAVSNKAAITKKASTELPDLSDNFFQQKFTKAIKAELANRQ
jgi:hypothetical protein